MKKLLLSFLLLAAMQQIKSQVVFCPPGAQWTNLFELVLPTEPRYSKIVYIGDSTIGAESYKVLRHNNFYLTGCDAPYTAPYKPYTLIKQRGDTIFMRSSFTQHNWQILYNFAAVAGDMWVDSLGAPNSKIYYTTFVDSVNYVTINNFQLKQLHVRVNCNGYGYNIAVTETVTITERIGFSGHLFPYFNPNESGICHGSWFINRLCYGDDAFGVQQFSNAGCYFTGLDETNQNPYELAFFPNPAHTLLSLKNQADVHGETTSATFSDLYGREIKRIAITESTSDLDIRDLSNGIYFASIVKNNVLLYRTKVIKQE